MTRQPQTRNGAQSQGRTNAIENIVKKKREVEFRKEISTQIHGVIKNQGICFPVPKSRKQARRWMCQVVSRAKEEV